MRAGDDRIKLFDPTQKGGDGNPIPIQLRPGAFGEGESRADTNELLKTGRYVPDPSEKYDIKDAQGNTHTVTGDALVANLNNGFRLETHEESIARHDAEDQAKEDARNAMSTVEATAVGIGTGATAGLLPKILPHGERTYAQAEREHPTATAVGEVAGAIGGAELSGLAGLAARLGRGAKVATEGASLVSKVAAPLVGGAAEGAVLSAPVAAVKLAGGDPEAAGEALLFGLGAGAAFGGVASAATKGLEAAGNAASYVGGKLKTAADSVLEDLPGARSLVRGADDEAVQAAGARVNDLGGTGALDDMVSSKGLAKRAEESYAQVADRIRSQHADDAQALDDLFARIGSADRQAVVDGVETRLMPELEAFEKRIARTTNDPAARSAIKEALPDLVDSDVTGRIDPQKLWQFKQAVAAQAKEAPQLLNTRKFLERELAKVADETLADDYIKLTKEFRLSDRALKLAQQSAEAEAAHASVSLLDRVKKAGWNALGETVSTPLGAMSLLSGHGLGHVVGKTGVNMVKDFVGGNADMLAPYGAKIGKALSDAASSEGAQRISRAVAQMKGAGTTASASSVGSIIRQFNGGGTHDPHLAFAQASQEIQRANQDPSYVDRKLQPITQHLAVGAPQAATAYADLVKRGYAYLNSKLPQPARIDTPWGVKPWQPPRDELRQFAHRLEVVNDPFIVAKRFKDGTLKPEHVEALDAVYPKHAQQIKSQLIAQATAGKHRLPASRRMKIEMLAYDADSPAAQSSATEYSAIQAVFNGDKPQPSDPLQAAMNPPRPQGKPIKLDDLPGALGDKGEGLTVGQRLEFRT